MLSVLFFVFSSFLNHVTFRFLPPLFLLFFLRRIFSYLLSSAQLLLMFPRRADVNKSHGMIFILIPTNLFAFKMLFKQQKPYELLLWRFRIHANTNKDEAFSCFAWSQSDIPLYISWPINACRLINSFANIGICSCACAQFTPAVWSDNFNQHA